jgi:hypothetical protein
MSKRPQPLSLERRVLFAFALALLVVVVFLYIRGRNSFSPLRASESLHRYIWKDSSGNVFVGFDSNAKLSAPESIGPRSDLTAVPADVSVPSAPLKGLTRQVFQLERQKSVAASITDAGTQDLLVGETHLGMSQLEVARTLCRLLSDFEIDAIFVEQPDDLQYDWAHFQSLEQRRAAALEALQYRMVQDARADLAPFLPYFKDAKTDEEALSKIEAQFGPSGGARLQAAMETEERYEKSKYVSASDYIYVALHLDGLSIPFHNIESRKLRDEFTAHEKDASSIEDLRPQIASRDDYMVQNSRRLINAYKYHSVIWIVGAEHLKNLERILSGDGDRVVVAYDSLATTSGQPNFKNEMISLVNPDELVKFANARVPADFQVNPAFSLPQGPSKQLSNAVAKALASHDLGLENSEREAIQNLFGQQYEAQKLRNQESWSVQLSIGTGGTIEITKPQRDSLEVFQQSPVKVRNQRELASIAPGFSTIDADLGRRLNHVNGEQRYVSLFTVRNQGRGYAVYANEQPFYEGDDIRELVRRLNEQLRSGQVSAMYLELDGFSSKDASGFEASCRIQQKVLNNDRSLRVLTHPADALFAPAQLDPSHEPQLATMKTGAFKGFTRMTMRFIVHLGDSLVHITLVVYAKTADLAQEFHTRLLVLLGGSLSLADSITATRIDLKKRHNLTDDDLSDQLRLEVGGTLVVEELRANATRA